ncbi:hypothetical protein RIF29_11311 [Crotalaria pallida]|uniref:Uncharacterized protein n=1 Tax=Crotalaria pallida TaxID=3830 RepID=A0AAN9IM11_CROPI
MVLKRKEESESSVIPIKKRMTRKKTSPPTSPEPESPIRPIACLTEIDDMKRFEESEKESTISLDLSQLPPSPPPAPAPSPSPSFSSSISSSTDDDDDDDDDDDVSIVSEKGQCYCYVCDLIAPCKFWSLHCNAENVGHWNDQRNKNLKKQQFP